MSTNSLKHPLTRALLVLTFTTGVIDAASYLGLGHVFTAKMTGNIVLLGFGIAGGSGPGSRLAAGRRERRGKLTPDRGGGGDADRGPEDRVGALPGIRLTRGVSDGRGSLPQVFVEPGPAPRCGYP